MTQPRENAGLPPKAGVRGGGRRGRGRAERAMVPEATFTSYYGKPIVKASPWTADIPAYLFLGGLAGGSSLLAAGGDLSGRTTLRRSSRFTAAAALTLSFGALVHDLGRPARFHHMLRVAKATSPMSVGTWVLTAYGPVAALAAASEAPGLLPTRLRKGALGKLLPGIGRLAGLGAALMAPPLASYTAVLISDTATPAWHDAQHQMPYLFVSSGASAAGGMGMLLAPLAEAGPARRMAIGGAVAELAIGQVMEEAMGLSSAELHAGKAEKYMKASHLLTAAGAAVGAVLGGRSRLAARVSGAAMVAGSACLRFGIFHAGQQSAADPRYTVVPQRKRLDEGRAASLEE